MNILWAVLSFTLAYKKNPLSGSVGLEAQPQPNALIAPLGPLFDALYLLCDPFYPPTHRCLHLPPGRVPPTEALDISSHFMRLDFREATRMLIRTRLNLPPRPLLLEYDLDNDMNHINPPTPCWNLKKTLRLILSIVSVLEFAKICGYSNTGMGHICAVMVFLPWLPLGLLFLTFNKNDGLRLPYPKSEFCRCKAGWVSHSEEKKALVRNAFLGADIMLIHHIVYLYLSIPFLPWRGVLAMIVLYVCSILVLVYRSPVRRYLSERLGLFDSDEGSSISRSFPVLMLSLSEIPLFTTTFLIYDLSGISKAAWTESLP